MGIDWLVRRVAGCMLTMLLVGRAVLEDHLLRPAESVCMQLEIATNDYFNDHKNRWMNGNILTKVARSSALRFVFDWSYVVFAVQRHYITGEDGRDLRSGGGDESENAANDKPSAA